MLQPKKDLYGPEADRSNLADYLELLALADAPMSRADLADYLADVTWTVRSRELYKGAPASSEEPSEDNQDGGAEITPQELWAEEVFGICESRALLLREGYPFELVGDRLVQKDPDAGHVAYLALLSITVAHHYGIQLAGIPTPDRIFEELTCAVMENRGLTTCNLGALGRTGVDFRQRVTLAGDQIGVAATPEAAISRTHSNDEKVDVVSNLAWGDQRGGHWLFIGQCTVGESGSWQRKMMQPRPWQWRDLMSSVLLPIAYLAVPHHVEDEQLADLTRGDARLVLDRLRLAKFVAQVTADAQSLILQVRGEAPFDPRGT